MKIKTSQIIKSSTLAVVISTAAFLLNRILKIKTKIMLKFNRRNKRLVIPVGINPNYGIDSSTLYNTDDADIVASDVLEGKVGYGKDGKIIGTLDIQSEKEESYQEGYEFGYNEGNDAGYQLGYNEGNEAGIEIGKAEVIEGMNDATITAGTVFKGEVGYGKDGERIVGDYEFVEGFDFGVIGYSENESNTVNRSISDDIAYSKQLMDAWDPSRTSAQGYFQRNNELIYAPNIDCSNIVNGCQSMFEYCERLVYVGTLNTSSCKYFGSMFYRCGKLITINLIDMTSALSMDRMFYNCSFLKSVGLINASNITNMDNTFYGCANLRTIPQLDTSNVTNMNYTFSGCGKLRTIPQLDTSNVTNMNYAFEGCSSLTEMPQLDTSKVEQMLCTFQSCVSLNYLPELNCSRINGNSSYSAPMRPFGYSTISIENIGGFKDLGKGYYSSLSQDASNLQINNLNTLSYESCMNVINKVYDMNLNTNFSKTPSIIFHATPYSLLSAEDIAIATNKGWTVQSA